MTIILDTSFLFALKAKKDKNYKRSNEILEKLTTYNSTILTNAFVVEETFTLTIARYGANLFYLDKYFNLFFGKDNFFKTIYFSSEDVKFIYEILKKDCTPKKLLSFVDASLIYLYNSNEAELLVSFDAQFDGIVSRMY